MTLERSVAWPMSYESADTFSGTGMSDRLVVVLCGRRGAGKTTQGRLLEEYIGAVHVGAGTLIRGRIRSGDQDVEHYLRESGRVPADISYGLLEKGIARSKPGSTLVLEGFPLEASEIPLLTCIVGRPSLVVLLELPADVAYKRVERRLTCVACDAPYGPGSPAPRTVRCGSCGGLLERREDDLETNRERATREEFFQPVGNAGAWVEEGGEVIKIDGRGAPQGINREIVTALKKVAERRGC